MTATLVDSNVLLDVLLEDAGWLDWSSRALSAESERGRLVIDPIVYAEVSMGFERPDELDEALPPGLFDREDLPWEAAFVAGKYFERYRRRGGVRVSLLPDFYIGAHAAVRGYRLLTREVRRYRTYFPAVTLVCPEPP